MIIQTMPKDHQGLGLATLEFVRVLVVMECSGVCDEYGSNFMRYQLSINAVSKRLTSLLGWCALFHRRQMLQW
jgi:hypothetical protein